MLITIDSGAPCPSLSESSVDAAAAAAAAAVAVAAAVTAAVALLSPKAASPSSATGRGLVANSRGLRGEDRGETCPQADTPLG